MAQLQHAAELRQEDVLAVRIVTWRPGELETLTWVNWFNHKRLLGPIGDRPPAEAEANYYRQQTELAIAA